MTRVTDDQRTAYLKEEYLFLQGQYEDYDRRSLTIKGWIGTGAIAALALGFNNSYGRGAAWMPIVTATIACVVWYLEADWKLFQYALSDRIRVIEAYFRADPEILDKSPNPFQIYNSWFRSYAHDEPIYAAEMTYRPRKTWRRLVDAALQRFVCAPYVVIIILSALSEAILVFHVRVPA